MKNPLFILSLLLLSQLFPACNTQQEPIVGLWKATYPFLNHEIVIYRLFEQDGEMFYVLEARHDEREPITIFAEGEWAEQDERTLWLRWKQANIELKALPEEAVVVWEPGQRKQVFIGHEGRMQHFEYQENADIRHFKKLFEEGLQMESHLIALNYISANEGGSLTDEEKNPAEPEKVAEVISELESQMVSVKGGTFEMGCTEADRLYIIGQECLPDLEAHQVQLADFKIGKFEVIQRQWYEVMRTRPWLTKDDCEECPVAMVSWKEAQEFTAKINSLSDLTFRLPTEAEWEYAARGGQKGLKNKKYIEYGHVGEMGTTSFAIPVGQKPPNPLGLYDMMGNIGEWCSDWYAEDYYKSSPNKNPKGPSKGKTKVFRGPYYCLAYQASYVYIRLDGWEGDMITGFRLAAN